MILTDYEKALLNGDWGLEAYQLMSIMLKVAEINECEELIDVEHVMIGNTGMMSVAGETGLNFLHNLAASGIKFKVPTYTNVISIDLNQWEKINIPEEYALNQIRAVEAWKELNAILSCSCMPFFCGAIPRYQSHVAYADTATVIFGNSFFGARSNRESDLVCLCAALCGRVPKFGYHLQENRLGQIAINVATSMENESDYDVLGCYLGSIINDKVPVFKNLDRNISIQALIQLGAALATTGAVSLFHCAGITPEIKQNPFLYGTKNIIDEINVKSSDIMKTYEQLNSNNKKNIDLIFIGCPHCSLDKLKYIAIKLAGRKICDSLSVWICVSSTVKHLATKCDVAQKIENAGVTILTDTCAVITPTRELGFRNVGTDSAKAQIYMSDFGLNVKFGTTEKCLDAAVNGYWSSHNA